MSLTVLDTYHDDALIVFMHLYKTGGTTFEEMLRNVYKPNYVLANPGDIPARIQQTTKALAGHISFSNADVAILNNIRKDLYTVTLFRDPIERVLSDYYWIRHHDFDYVVPIRNEPIEAWLEQGFTRGINQMTWFFSGAPTEAESTVSDAQQNIQNSISMFGLLEQVDEFFTRCSGTFGWAEIPESYHAKQNPHRPSAEHPDTIATIQSYNQKDLELYSWVVDRYNTLYGE